MRGDYVELLPRLLADRREGTQLVVFQSASTMYLDQAAVERFGPRCTTRRARSRSSMLTTGRAPDDDASRWRWSATGRALQRPRVFDSTASGSTGR